MKRRVIQIANSTQLISLPRAWAKRNNIQKGQELDIQEDGSRVVIQSSDSHIFERHDIDISKLDGMAIRSIRALYKRGIDELKVTFSRPELLKLIQESISKDVVGFEILEQGQSYCVIRNVAGNTEGFDHVLRRTFLLLVSMADEFIASLKKGDYSHLKNVAFLEQTNNRFTMVLRRHINKNGKVDYDKLGPLYYIIESIENIGDEYKYICLYLHNNAKRNLPKREYAELAQKTAGMLRDFYEVFYKFDEEKLVRLKNSRNAIVNSSFSLMKKQPNASETMLIHHSITVAQKVFNMVGPYLVLTL
ncbi:phosphate uptake regulator PhoU [Candidatus Woesearchaeota archaeon]|nr:phosphate uptake regulator PhoU [Candidatus Woesearchaeota archaeon]